MHKEQDWVAMIKMMGGGGGFFLPVVIGRQEIWYVEDDDCDGWLMRMMVDGGRLIW